MDYIIFLYLNSEKLCNKVVNPEKVKIQIELTQNIKTFEQEHISSYPKVLSSFLLSSHKTQFRNSDSTFFVRHKPAIVWIMQFSIYQQILDQFKIISDTTGNTMDKRNMANNDVQNTTQKTKH